MVERYAKAAEAIRNAASVIAVTGAGASVESGIPDFRSPGGLWERFPPEEYATIEAYVSDPDRVWALWRDLGKMFRECTPNPGHHALAELEGLGCLRGVITQNIDGLHQAAGNHHVVEYHGNASRLVCLSCKRRMPLDTGREYTHAPLCDCGGLMKPDVVLFGEVIPVYAQMESQNLAREADVVIVVGTSATVYPAAEIPALAKRHGAYIIECNLEPTDFTPYITDAFLQGPAGKTLPYLLDTVRG